MDVLGYAIEKLNFANMLSSLLNIKAKLRKYFAMTVLGIAGVIILMLGLASYLKSVYPVLDNGGSEMIIGAVLLLVSLIIYQRR